MANKMLPRAITPKTTEYEGLRTRFFNTRVPDSRPAKIYIPKNTAEVVEIIKEAQVHQFRVGVRSGGHSFPCTSLINDGILIDTIDLNQGPNEGIKYDSQTRQISFPPYSRSKDLCDALYKVGRFFPFGHDPTVAAGGFCLAGGQGWFMRGWGCTSDSWIQEMEIVVPNGEVVRASKTNNPDLFWAARGSGLGFFGVVTRFWARTIPQRKLYEIAHVIDCTSSFESVVETLFKLQDITPKYGVEIALATFYPDRNEVGISEEVCDNRVFMGVSALAYADSLEEADVLLSHWKDLKPKLGDSLLVTVPLVEKKWEQLFDAQYKFSHRGNGERWQCDSILDRSGVPTHTLINAIKPALYDLPSRRSVGFIYFGEYVPNENDQAISLPQHYYISTMTCWTDPAWDEAMSKWMKDAYRIAETVSCGQYIADFDVNQRMTPVMSPTALARFLMIRQKWDPDELFTGYRGFAGLAPLKPKD